MIVVFGTVCLDRMRRVPDLPPRGGYVEALSDETLLGGEAANTANCLTAWGEEVTLVTHPFGDDLDGDIVRNLLSQQGLHARELERPFSYEPDQTPETPVCDVYITPDGERTMFGRGFQDTDRWIDASRVPIYPGRWFTAEPNMPTASRDAARRAAEGGMRIWLMDFVRDEDVMPENGVWQTSTDWAGVKRDRDANLAHVAAVRDRFGCDAILTDGARGLAVADAEGVAWIDPVVAPRVVDTTGAGDHFRAACLRVMNAGGTVRDAVRVGRAAGALACGHIGATTHVSPWHEVMELSRSAP